MVHWTVNKKFKFEFKFVVDGICNYNYMSFSDVPALYHPKLKIAFVSLETGERNGEHPHPSCPPPRISYALPLSLDGF
jgi:hypothetical protein